MTTELLLLGVAVLLGLAQVLAPAAGGVLLRQRDLRWAAGARDEARPLSGIPARLDRALRNYQENFPLFAAALLAVHLADKTGSLTLWGAHLWVWSRVLYVPAYAFGSPLRPLFWATALAGLGLILIALFA